MNGSPPTLGSAGSVTTDPDFSTKVLRVTQDQSCGEASGDNFAPNGGQGWLHSISKSDDMVLINDSANNDWFYQGLTTSPLGLSGSCTNIKSNSSITRFPAFSYVTDKLIYGLDADGKTLDSWDMVVGHSTTHIKDMTTIPGFSLAGSNFYLVEFDRSDGWFCTVDNGQDLGHKIGCYNQSTANTQVLNLTTATSQQNSSGAVALDNLSSTQLANCEVHEITVAADSSWLAITMNGCTSFPTNPAFIFYQLRTNHVVYLPTNFSSHDAMGYSGAFINSAHNQPPCGTYDNRGWDLWFASNLGTAKSPNIVGMYGCSIVIPDANNFDAHVSWLNNKNDGNVNKYPVIVLPFPSASSDTNHNYYMEWEIDAIDTAPALNAWNASRFLTGPTATVWRIAHTFNDPWAAQCSAAAYLSPNVSQDGRYIVFHSDWKGGTGKGTCTNSRRLDMFIADATSQGGQPPAPPPSLSIISIQ